MSANHKLIAACILIFSEAYWWLTVIKDMLFRQYWVKKQLSPMKTFLP